MVKLDPGEVKPRGWLRDWCETARDGYLLHLDEYDAEFTRAWSVDYTPTGARLNWPAVKDEKTGADPAFAYDYRLDPATALVGATVERRPMPAKWAWQLDAPVRVSVKAATGETLSLVPYGCTRLRKTMFARDLPADEK